MMTDEELSVVASLVLAVCPVSNQGGASITATRIAPAPPRLPDETPEPAHPPHGEGSGELLIFTGISASGTISNVHANAVSSLWEPPSRAHSEFDHLVAKRVPRVMLKVSSVAPQRHCCRVPAGLAS
jgi:hypothetical protein